MASRVSQSRGYGVRDIEKFRKIEKIFFAQIDSKSCKTYIEPLFLEKKNLKFFFNWAGTIFFKILEKKIEYFLLFKIEDLLFHSYHRLKPQDWVLKSTHMSHKTLKG